MVDLSEYFEELLQAIQDPNTEIVEQGPDGETDILQPDPRYDTNGEDPEVIDSTDEDFVEWDFVASTVTVYGPDSAAVLVGFTEPNAGNGRLIRVPAGGQLELGGPNALNAERLYYRKIDESDADQELYYVARQ